MSLIPAKVLGLNSCNNPHYQSYDTDAEALQNSQRDMPIKPRISLDAQRTIRGAFKDLEEAITTRDRVDLRDITLEGVRNAACLIEDQLAARQSLRNMRRLMPLFTGMEHYSKTIEVLCNGTPYLAWIWAPIKLILKVRNILVLCLSTTPLFFFNMYGLILCF